MASDLTSLTGIINIYIDLLASKTVVNETGTEQFVSMPNDPINISIPISYGPAAPSIIVDQIYSAKLVIPPTSALSLNLTDGSLLNSLGGTIGFKKIFAVYAKNSSTETGPYGEYSQLEFGGNYANETQLWFSNHTFSQLLNYNTILLNIEETGWDVWTDDVLTIGNADPYIGLMDLIIVGVNE